MNSGSGVAAAISYPLSVYYKVPHGIGGGIFLLGIARFNEQKGFSKYDNLFRLIDNPLEDNFLSHMEMLFSILDVPSDLSVFEISIEDKEKICEVMKTQQLAFDQNPYKFTVEDDFPKFIGNYLS